MSSSWYCVESLNVVAETNNFVDLSIILPKTFESQHKATDTLYYNKKLRAWNKNARAEGTSQFAGFEIPSERDLQEQYGMMRVTC